MSDDLKLELARKIHGTPHATRTSFTATTWSGVERAWEWIGKNYHPQEPPMKQDHGCRGCNDPAYFHTPECIAKRPPPWTAEQREAAYSVAHNAIALSAQDALAMTDPGKDGDAFMRELARIAPLFVSPPPVPSVEVCERAYNAGWCEGQHPSRRGLAMSDAERAGIAAVRALFVQGDGVGASIRKDEDAIINRVWTPAPSPTPAPDREAITAARDAALARVAELEKAYGSASAARDEYRHNWNLERARGDHGESEVTALRATIATLTKERDEARGNAIDVEACARELADFCGRVRDLPFKYSMRPDEFRKNLAAILRKHFTSKARSVTREDAISLAVELMLPDKEIVDALRAIGFEVVG